MRDYGKVSPQFWTGKTGKRLRGEAEAQLVALYLMTSPHANMIGVYHVPVLYLAHETGLPLEGARKGLQRCIEVGFCVYDDVSETVFVMEMAAHQVGATLKASDNRARHIAKLYQGIAESRVRQAFFERYGRPFDLRCPDVCLSLSKGASEGASEEVRSHHRQEQEQEQEQKREVATRGTRLPVDWACPAEWLDWARSERSDLDVDREAACFADYWRSKPGKEGRKSDWLATWRLWIRRATPRRQERNRAELQRERVDL